MKDSPLVHTSTGTSFEASSATGDAVNLYITDVTFSAITATTAVAQHTTDAETPASKAVMSTYDTNLYQHTKCG